jgi:hypothetical protein
MFTNCSVLTAVKQCQILRKRWVIIRSGNSLLFLFLFSLLLVKCGLDIENSTPPSPPVWVQKSLPEEWPERGIDAHESGGIYLEWESNREENVVAYQLFRATWYETNDSIGDYNFISRIGEQSQLVLSYFDDQVAIRSRYYYKLKAEASIENFSTFSDSIYYSLLPQLTPHNMTPRGSTDTLNDQRMLSWVYSTNIEMENYCLTILTIDSELITRIILSPTNYVTDRESWQIPDSLVLTSEQIYKWRIDTGANYIAGIESSGSESLWANFLYIGD